jgi:xylulokinase
MLAAILQHSKSSDDFCQPFLLSFLIGPCPLPWRTREGENSSSLVGIAASVHGSAPTSVDQSHQMTYAKVRSGEVRDRRHRRRDEVSRSYEERAFRTCSHVEQQGFPISEPVRARLLLTPSTNGTRDRYSNQSPRGRLERVSRSRVSVTLAIGLDVGSQSIKGVLLDGDGVERAVTSAALTMSHPRGGWAEQNPRHFEDGIASVIANLLSTSRCDGSDVRALSLACQVDGVVALSPSGEALGNAIIWLDRRADVQAKDMATSVGKSHLFEVTGLVPDGSHSGPKILWLRDNDLERFTSAMAFPPVAGYLLHRLTGRLALDHANASSSMLYDLRSRTWSDELLETFGLHESQLGEILNASEIAGTLNSRAAAALGLSESCAVLVGTGDEHAASIGAGAITDGVITDVTGTAEPVTVTSKKFVLDREMLVETHAHAVDGYYLVENPGFVSGGSTKWLADNVLGVHQAAVFELAAQAPVGADGVLFIPALSGSMTPTWNSQMRGSFAGLAMSHSSHTMARAVLEGCAFALRDIVERFTALGLGRDEIRVVGGGAASDTWMQIKADVTGRPMHRVTVREATALGAALLAGVTAGIFSDLEDAVNRSVTLADAPFAPDPTNRSRYDEDYGRYRRLYDAIEGALT